MYDIEKLGKMMADIERYFKDLRIFGLNSKTINDTKTFYSSSMAMFGILNRTIDLAEEIIVKNEFGMPQSYQEYFIILSNEGIINKKLAEEMKKLAKARNLFAHEYYVMNKKEVLKLSKNIYAVKDFIESIKKRIKKTR